VRFAEDQNDFAAQERVISTKDSKVMVVVIPTDEELMIAKEVLKSIKS
jgi:acetate kinase